MSLDKPKRIDDFIIKYLQTGPILILDLIEKIKKDRPKTTKQAVYAALRLLKKTELIITYRGMASLNLTWLNSMINYFAIAKHNYIKTEINQNNFLDLEEKEKIKYYFQDAIKADIFWTHSLFLLVERSAPDEPIFIYNPHEWFLLARNENEINFFKNINRKGKRAFVTVGHRLFLDKYVKKYFNDDLSQYHALENPLFKSNNYYINIIGDFLIEVWLDKKISNNIERFYQETDSWDEKSNIKLQKIISTKGQMRMVISKNHKKADRIKHSLKKYFILK